MLPPDGEAGVGDTVASIAIVGGAGFVGRRLAESLERNGHAVTTVDVAGCPADGAEHRSADVRERGALTAALAGADAVYNLAAVHRDDVRPVSLYYEVNVAGAENVCGACSRLGIDRLIFTSSVAVYGLGGPEASEDREPAPFNAYGQSKLRAEQVHREWQAEAPERRSLVIVRPTVVFGEGNRGNVYELLRQIAAGRFVMVGSGRNRKSMAYVGNLGAFLVHALGMGAGTHLFNYVDKPDLSMRELVDAILQALGRPPSRGRIPYMVGYLGGLACDLIAGATGRKLPVSAVRVRKFCSTTTFAADRVRSTGFRPPVSVREALTRTITHEIGRGADGIGR